MVKLWSEITSDSSTIWPYFLHRTIFTQNGLWNFRLEVLKILVLSCGFLLYHIISVKQNRGRCPVPLKLNEQLLQVKKM